MSLAGYVLINTRHFTRNLHYRGDKGSFYRHEVAVFDFIKLDKIYRMFIIMTKKLGRTIRNISKKKKKIRELIIYNNFAGKL